MARERYAHGSVGVPIYGSSSSATKPDPARELGSRSRFSQFKHSIETHPVICRAEALFGNLSPPRCPGLRTNQVDLKRE